MNSSEDSPVRKPEPSARLTAHLGLLARRDVDGTRWWTILRDIRLLKGVPQADLAAHWKDLPGGPGKDRSFISKMEHGKVKGPPSRTALYYMGKRLKLDLHGPEMVVLALLCYGQPKLPKVLEFWGTLELTEAIRSFAQTYDIPSIDNRTEEADQLSPENPLFGMLYLRMLSEVANQPEYWKLLAQFLQRPFR